MVSEVAYAFKDATNLKLKDKDSLNLTHLTEQDESIKDVFVISQAEMGPISVENYQKMKKLPQTMLDEKNRSFDSSTNKSKPSVVSSVNIPFSPSESNY